MKKLQLSWLSIYYVSMYLALSIFPKLFYLQMKLMNAPITQIPVKMPPHFIQM